MQNQDTDFLSPIKEYKAGDILRCRILEKSNGGYALNLPDNDIRDAFLPTSVKLREGDELDVLFVFCDGKRIFCSYSDEEFKRRVEFKASQDQPTS